MKRDEFDISPISSLLKTTIFCIKAPRKKCSGTECSTEFVCMTVWWCCNSEPKVISTKVILRIQLKIADKADQSQTM